MIEKELGDKVDDGKVQDMQESFIEDYSDGVENLLRAAIFLKRIYSRGGTMEGRPFRITITTEDASLNTDLSGNLPSMLTLIAQVITKQLKDANAEDYVSDVWLEANEKLEIKDKQP